MFSGQGAVVARRLLGQIKPDVLFSHSFYGFGRGMPQMLEATGIPWLHYVHSYGLVCKRQTAMTYKGDVCPRQCLDCKVICHFKHGGAPLREAITIYNSHYMREFFEEAGVATRESHVIDPVFSYDSIKISDSYEPAAPIRLVYVGRVSHEKGIDLLCDAVAAEPMSYRLEVLGDGPMLGELVARHGSAPIRFHGHVGTERRDALLREGHALVVPSQWNEPFGRVVQEGFLAGLPVIAANVGAIGSLVRHGVDGIVFNWRIGSELESLAAALKEATPELARLRLGALETRQRLLGQDNLALIEELLDHAVRAPAMGGALP
jgi:glycosyltransferase involved in cell wall biosynthesis